ncbi:hypothetical protein CA265_11435 [Sphingobacteriaceae bacterium GW460-11-11-14-LB5]|nr:hypothetical protein CA265_11435 [Sphingobacteriaceae bacterium GW460-11-11-14-LB5]
MIQLSDFSGRKWMAIDSAAISIFIKDTPLSRSLSSAELIKKRGGTDNISSIKHTLITTQNSYA